MPHWGGSRGPEKQDQKKGGSYGRRLSREDPDTLHAGRSAPAYPNLRSRARVAGAKGAPVHRRRRDCHIHAAEGQHLQGQAVVSLDAAFRVRRGPEMSRVTEMEVGNVVKSSAEDGHFLVAWIEKGKARLIDLEHPHNWVDVDKTVKLEYVAETVMDWVTTRIMNRVFGPL